MLLENPTKQDVGSTCSEWAHLWHFCHSCVQISIKAATQISWRQSTDLTCRGSSLLQVRKSGNKMQNQWEETHRLLFWGINLLFFLLFFLCLVLLYSFSVLFFYPNPPLLSLSWWLPSALLPNVFLLHLSFSLLLGVLLLHISWCFNSLSLCFLPYRLYNLPEAFKQYTNYNVVTSCF